MVFPRVLTYSLICYFCIYFAGLWTWVPNVILEERLIGEFSELQLQFSLILRVAVQI